MTQQYVLDSKTDTLSWETNSDAPTPSPSPSEDAIKISVSDARRFLRCRRQWDIMSPNRQDWQSVGERTSFFVGRTVHQLLETCVRRGSVLSYAELINEIQSTTLADAEEKYLQTYGYAMPPIVKKELYGPMVRQSAQMVAGYQKFWGVEPLAPKYRYLDVEVPITVRLPNTDVWWVGTLDGIAEDVKTHELIVVEHKTYSTPPVQAAYTLDDQFNMYAWALSQVTGEPVAGILYDGISSRQPDKPRVLNNGTLSTHITASMTEESYLEAIAENMLNANAYGSQLKLLRERPNPIYRRFFIPSDETVQASAVESLSAIAQDMNAVKVGTSGIYTHRPYRGCGDCTVRTICTDLTNKVEPDYSNYVQGRAYGTFQSECKETLDYSWRLTLTHPDPTSA